MTDAMTLPAAASQHYVSVHSLYAGSQSNSSARVLRSDHPACDSLEVCIPESRQFLDYLALLAV